MKICEPVSLSICHACMRSKENLHLYEFCDNKWRHGVVGKFNSDQVSVISVTRRLCGKSTSFHCHHGQHELHKHTSRLMFVIGAGEKSFHHFFRRQKKQEHVAAAPFAGVARGVEMFA